ncbi:MAG: anion permease [Thermoplasmatota archaeon]
MFGLGIGSIIMIAITMVFGFYMAWTIGANDVANSMGTVFGSGSISLKKIIIIAAIFEFLGAFLVGAHVTETLKSGIVDPSYFQNVDYFTGDRGIYIFIAGMLSVLLAASLWVTLATYRSLPISTSQSIVGAVAGFGLISVLLQDIPLGSINGSKLIEISTGWVVSPFLGGALSFLLFSIIKKTIFDSKRPEKIAHIMVSTFIILVFFILLMAGLSGGLKNLRSVLEEVVSGRMLDLFFNNLLLKVVIVGTISIFIGIMGGIFLKRSKNLNNKDPNERVEIMFSGLLILTACYVAFAHGANDVANAIGPVAAIVQTLMNGGEISGTVGIPIWVLAIGGLGIVVGISTWGYKVMNTIGKKITHITPTRGFSASFGAASSVLLCSLFGIPVSTSQIIVGSVIGVGMAGGIAAIDLRVIRTIIISWVFTIPVAAVTTGFIFLFFRAIAINLL